MMSIFKKLTAIAMVCCMVLSMAACGNNATQSSSEDKTSSTAVSISSSSSANEVEEETYFNKEGYPICDEQITVTLAGNSGSKVYDWNNNHLVGWVAENLGIKLDCTPYPKDAWESQRTLLLAGDELPDIVVNYGITMNEANKYGKDGYFLPLDEYLEYMPNFKKYLEEYPEYEKILTADDGHIYGLSQLTLSPTSLIKRVFISNKWLENVGKEVPTNVDELYEVLVAFKEQDANGNGDATDEIPVSGGFQNHIMFMHYFGLNTNDMTYSPIVGEDGKVFLGQATENYKAMLKFVNKLHEEGLLDKDALVQTSDEFNAKCVDDRIGMYATGSAPYVHAKKDTKWDGNFTWIGGLTSDYQEEKVVPMDNVTSLSVKLAVNADTEYPEAICRLIDHFYTDEGILQGSKGVEGKTYVFSVGQEDPETGEILFPGYRLATGLKLEGYASAEETRYTVGTINNGFNLIGAFKASTAEAITLLSDEELAKTDLYYGWANQVERGRRKLKEVSVFPTLVYTDEENDRRVTLMTDIKMYIQQAYGQFVTGELDVDKDWDAYIKTLESIGMKELMEIEQAAYD